MSPRRVLIWSALPVSACLFQAATEGWRSLVVFDLKENWALRFSLMILVLFVAVVIVGAVAEVIWRRLR